MRLYSISTMPISASVGGRKCSRCERASARPSSPSPISLRPASCALSFARRPLVLLERPGCVDDGGHLQVGENHRSGPQGRDEDCRSRNKISSTRQRSHPTRRSSSPPMASRSIGFTTGRWPTCILTSVPKSASSQAEEVPSRYVACTMSKAPAKKPFFSGGNAATSQANGARRSEPRSSDRCRSKRTPCGAVAAT